MLGVSRSRQTGEFHTSPELMNTVIDRIHKLSSQNNTVVGIRTGFEALDRVTHGFQRGDLMFKGSLFVFGGPSGFAFRTLFPFRVQIVDIAVPKLGCVFGN